MHIITALLSKVRADELGLRVVEPVGAIHPNGEMGEILLYDLPATDGWGLLEDVAEGHRRQLDPARKADTVSLAPGEPLQGRARPSARAGPLSEGGPIADPVAKEGKCPGVEVGDDDVAFHSWGTRLLAVEHLDEREVVSYVEPPAPAGLGEDTAVVAAVLVK
jgi:hypothetical protein